MKLLISSALLVCAFNSAVAAQPSFSYVEVGFRDFEEFTGPEIRGSVEASDNIYFTASYSDLSDEQEVFSQEFDIDFTLYDFGVGFKQEVGESSALYLEANYVDAETKVSSIGSNSEDGFRATAGLRSAIGNSVQLYADISHLDVSSSATEVTAGIKGYFSEYFGLFAEFYRNDFDSDGYTIGVSVRF